MDNRIIKEFMELTALQTEIEKRHKELKKEIESKYADGEVVDYEGKNYIVSISPVSKLIADIEKMKNAGIYGEYSKNIEYNTIKVKEIGQ